MQLFPKQIWSIHRSTSPINLWWGSVRAGKTHASLIRWVQYVAESVRTEKPGDLFLVGKTVGALKRNVINPLMEFLGSSAEYYPGKQELEMFGRAVSVVGANDERAEGKIRGSTCGGAYCDEVSLYVPSFWYMLLSRMSVKDSMIFGTTNPDNPNHWLKKEYIDNAEKVGMRTFKFLMEDNTFLEESYINNIKSQYTGFWYKRFIEGEWCAAEGAIHDYFREELHTRKIAPHADGYIVGVDYGTGNSTVFLLIGYNRSMRLSWVEREYYWDSKVEQRQKTDYEYANDMVEWLDGLSPEACYVDPSAASFKQQLKATLFSRGVYMSVKDADNSVLDGIRFVSSVYITGKHFIKTTCSNLIQEKYSYMWDSKAALHGEDKPLKIHDHCNDAERYALYTHFGDSHGNYSSFLEG